MTQPRPAADGGGDRPASIERALQPLQRLNPLLHEDTEIRAALSDVARRSRCASDSERRLIRLAAIDRLALLRKHEWSAERCEAEVSAAMEDADSTPPPAIRLRADAPDASARDRMVEWPDPVPLTEYAELPAFPLSALPATLRDWVVAEAHATQTPPDLPAMLALAMVAIPCQRVMIVHVRAGWSEPLCLYTAPVLPPGTRKSAVMADAREPLDAYERDQAQSRARDISRSHDAFATAQKRHSHAIDIAAKKHGDERLAAEQDVREARDELDRAERELVHTPQLSCGDATQEALAKLLARHGECMALLDSEGIGPFANMLGRYTDGTAAIDLYLRAHAGDQYRRDRASGETLVLRRPALTMALAIQPDVLRQLGERHEMRGLGLLARILFVVPVSTVGRRTSRPAPMPDHVRAMYGSLVRTLLELERRDNGEPHCVQLSAAADDALTEWSDRLEPRLGPGGELEHVADWANKLAGACARIAALLHAAEHPDRPWGAEISADTTRRALAIGEYLLAHARAALAEMGTDPVLADARYVLTWMSARNVRTIARRDLHRELRGRFRKAADIQPALDLLAERDWIRSHDPEGGGPGRKPSPIIELSPRARALGRNGHNGRDPNRDANNVQCVHSVPVGVHEEIVL